MSDCLTLDRLQDLVEQGDTPFPQHVSDHLGICETCREKLSEAQANVAMFKECRDVGLDPPPEVPSTPDPPSVTSESEAQRHLPRIEGYEILEEIHRGAQGVVYKAIQRNTRRAVALKVLLHGPYASRRQKLRFEREIDLVAGLEHPNIVTLFDSGQSDGRHYFAMQFISGVPLNAHAARIAGDVREILTLFVKICRAVAYAHQHGVIHRDLKPSNIYVNAGGEPHILDFGLAKPAQSSNGADSLATRTGEFFGTLAYTSPEQVSGSPQAVGTRTDVYALGVILYELLTGRRPYDVDGSISMIIHNITEVQPPKPSRIKERLNDEIDCIIAKALAKDPDRRYASVDALANDVQRRLDGRPIEAKSDSGWYVLRKNIIRYRVAASVATLFVLALIAFAAAMSIQSARIARQRDRAIAAEQLAEEQMLLAQKQARTLRRTLYSHKMALARNAYDSKDVAGLVSVLDECPPDLRGWEWHYLREKSDRSESTTQLNDGVECVAVASDGRLYATGTEVGQVIVWDAETALQVRTMVGHTGSVRCVAFSPDDKYIASGDEEGSAKIWEVQTGREILALHCPKGQRYPGVYAVAFSPDGKRLATGGGDNVLRLWDNDTGEPIRVFPKPSSAPNDYVRFASFFPDGKRILAGGGSDGSIRIWGVDTGREQRVILGHAGGVSAADLSADARRMVTASLDKTVRIWQVETGHEQLTLTGHENWVLSAVFSPDEACILSADRNGSIRMWNTQTGAPIRTYSGHTAHKTYAVFHPDGETFISGSRDKTVRVWSTGKGRALRIWRTHRRGAGSAVFAPDGKHFASVGLHDGHLKICDLETSTQVFDIGAHERDATAVDYAPDGSAILTTSTDKTLKTWDTRTGKRLHTFVGHEVDVFDAAYSPDGTRIVSAGGDGTVRLWDAESGRQLKTFVHTAQVWEIAYSPTGHHVAFGGDDKNVTVWSPHDGRVLHTLTGHEAAIDALAFSPDGKRLLSGAWDKSFRIWDLETGELDLRWNTSEDRTYCAAFSPDGRRVVSGHRNKIFIWDPIAGHLLLTIAAHDDSIYSVSFSPDGRALLSASADGAVKLWPT